MNNTCPVCSGKITGSAKTCDQCGNELVDNGQLMEAMTYWSGEQAPNATRNLITLGIVVAAGVGSSTLHHWSVMAAGLALAALYFYKSK